MIYLALGTFILLSIQAVAILVACKLSALVRFYRPADKKYSAYYKILPGVEAVSESLRTSGNLDRADSVCRADAPRLDFPAIRRSILLKIFASDKQREHSHCKAFSRPSGNLCSDASLSALPSTTRPSQPSAGTRNSPTIGFSSLWTVNNPLKRI
jgi:hypothetical protein